MYNKQFIFSIQIILFLLFTNLFSASAETIILKSGQEIRGEIVEKTGQYIKIKIKDIPFPLTYYLDEIEKIEEKTPISSGSTAPNSSLGDSKIKEFLVKIQQYFLKEEYEKTIPLLQKVIELEPEEPNHYINLGISYFFLKKFEDSISSFQKALKIDPEDGDAYVALGIVYAYINYPEKSKENFLKAIKSYNKENEEDIEDEGSIDFSSIFLAHFLLEKIDEYAYGK